MTRPMLSIPPANLRVETATVLGPCEWWRHTLSHGGVNALPLPENVVTGVKKFSPRLIRIFIQEHFEIYPDHGHFNWTKLDLYMDALERTGAKVVAAITIKPPVLFPRIDQSVWMPVDVDEWHQVIRALVQRYSVERPLVTYWEVGNETDIGESGGSPYLIPDPEPYSQFYGMTIKPILEAYPTAKVGGPAACWIDNEPLPGLVRYCRETGTQLDFISWHLYSNEPLRHASGVAKAKTLLESFPGKRPEMLVTEWAPGFERLADEFDTLMLQPWRFVSVEEIAFESRRAAVVGASILAMLDLNLAWSFYYHIWDQVFYPDAFSRFFSGRGLKLMGEHWNEIPHRFGLFGVGGEVRPQYFVYQMLSRLGADRISVASDEPDVRALVTRSPHQLSTLIVNFNSTQSQDRVVQVYFSDLAPGRRHLKVYRIDEKQRWSRETLELDPVEQREVVVSPEFRCQVYAPADSVTLLQLEDIEATY